MNTEHVREALIPRLLTLPALVMLAALALSGTHAWAAPADCSFTAAEGSGMGGTGAVAEGSGIGGTGAPTTAAATTASHAGRVIFSQGTAEARGAGGSRPLVKGMPVCVGDTIVTSSSAKLQIRMDDGGMLSIRPNTRVKIDVFHFDGKEDGSEKSVITLLQGGFRALTGMIGHTHKENYAIRTPFANIGIRGTDHEPMFIPNPAPGETAAGIPGTYDKVNSGGVVIRNEGGAVDVKPDQIGFVPNDPEASPTLLSTTPSFYRPGAGGEREGGSRVHGDHQSGEKAGRDEGKRGHGAAERREGHEIHVPEPHSDSEHSPDMKMPELQAPEAPEAPEADD